MKLYEIFIEFLKIGSFSFGGGMATLPYIYEMAQNTSWITEDYINRILAFSQVTPGPLACNIGTVVGYNVKGICGSVVANIAFILPAILFMGISFKFTENLKKNEKINNVIKNIRASSLAILLTSSIVIFKKAFLNETLKIINAINFKSVILGIILYCIIKQKKFNTFYIMIFSAVIGGLLKI